MRLARMALVALVRLGVALAIVVLALVPVALVGRDIRGLLPVPPLWVRRLPSAGRA